MDQRCLSSFIVARGLLERGTLELDGAPPSYIAAVILYDVAVETAAKATLRVRPPTTFPGDGYLITQRNRERQQREHLPWVMDKLLASYRELYADIQAELPGLLEARRLHDYRNMVQHDGSVPSPQDAERQRFRAGDFIDSLLQGFFGRRLRDVSRAILVQNKEVRTYIETAEQRLAAEDLELAAQQLAIAFEVARHVFRTGQRYDSRKLVNVPNVHDVVYSLTKRFEAVEERRNPLGLLQLELLLEALVRRSEVAEDRLEALSLGAQASDYAWFRDRFPRAHQNMQSGHWSILQPAFVPRAPITREEVARGLDFVTTVALHWQRFPDPELDEGESA